MSKLLPDGKILPEIRNDGKPVVSGSAQVEYEYYADGQPCKGRACWAHKTKPCEYCGRVACQGEAKIPKLNIGHFRLRPEIAEVSCEGIRYECREQFTR